MLFRSVRLAGLLGVGLAGLLTVGLAGLLTVRLTWLLAIGLAGGLARLLELTRLRHIVGLVWVGHGTPLCDRCTEGAVASVPRDSSALAPLMVDVHGTPGHSAGVLPGPICRCVAP